mgnify:CR=1 FL=1
MDNINALIEDLREDGEDLTALTSTDIDNLSTEETIRLGHALWDLISASNQAMDLIKARMRSMSNGSNRTFLGGDSACHINRIPDHIMLRKEINVAELRNTLGASYPSLFREQIDPVADFMERLEELTPEQASLALAAVDLKQRSSRVMFTDDRKSRPDLR